jgi:hypothetical protein
MLAVIGGSFAGTIIACLGCGLAGFDGKDVLAFVLFRLNIELWLPKIQRPVRFSPLAGRHQALERARSRIRSAVPTCRNPCRAGTTIPSW